MLPSHQAGIALAALLLMPLRAGRGLFRARLLGRRGSLTGTQASTGRAEWSIAVGPTME
jgi:hypothetical protein